MSVRGTIFPWRGGNRFELLLDGPMFFPRMLAAIDAAQRQVELELYLVEDGQCSEQLVEALCRAAARGVSVRGLFDAYGAAALGAASRQRLLAAGVQLRWYNPIRWRRGVRNFHRDHRKLLLVDRHLAYVGVEHTHAGAFGGNPYRHLPTDASTRAGYNYRFAF